MFALVRTGGRQYKVSPGEIFKVDRLAAEPAASVLLDEVLLVSDEDGVLVGAPLVSGANVACTVLRHERGPKVRVFRFKAKKGYRKRSGQRRELTVLRVDGVSADGKNVARAEAKPKISVKTKAAARPTAKPTAKATSKATAKPKAVATSKAAAKPKAKATATAKSKAAAKPKARPKATAKSKAAAKPETKGKAKASAKAKSKAKSKSKVGARAKSTPARK